MELCEGRRREEKEGEVKEEPTLHFVLIDGNYALRQLLDNTIYLLLR